MKQPLRYLRFCTVFVVLVLTACSGLQALNAITPRSGYTVYKDKAYGSLPQQKLDVYVPNQPDPAHTIVVFFHGGNWQTGDKSLYRFVGQSLALQGYMTVIADYRLYPQAYFPTYVEDAAQAVKWVHQHGTEFKGDPNHLYVMGHSAGAHLATMVTFDERYLEQIGGQTQWIKGVIGLAGPYDFLPLTDPTLKKLFSKVPLERTQPINFVKEGEPPVLLLHGEADTTVYLKNSVHLANQLRVHSNQVVFKSYPRTDHSDIVQAISVRFADRAPVIHDIVDFIGATNAR